RFSWVVSLGSFLLGRFSWVVSLGSILLGRFSWVVSLGSILLGRFLGLFVLGWVCLWGRVPRPLVDPSSMRTGGLHHASARGLRSRRLRSRYPCRLLAHRGGLCRSVDGCPLDREHHARFRRAGAGGRTGRHRYSRHRLVPVAAARRDRGARRRSDAPLFAG